MSPSVGCDVSSNVANECSADKRLRRLASMAMQAVALGWPQLAPTEGTPMPTWLLLAAAITCEVTATAFLRVTDGFTKLWPSLIVIAGYGVSFYLLSLIMRTGIPAGIVYAIWSAFGIALVTLVGMATYGDKITPVTGVGLAVIVVGVILVQVGNVGEAAS